MRSLVYTGPRQLEWREAPEPVLDADHQALVRPIASAACDLDRRIVAGATPMQGPFAIGHEAVGEVLEVGDVAAAGGLRPGMRVVIPWHLSCGSCAQCLARRPGNCTSTPPLASYGTPLGGHHGGLFDDAVRVPWAAYALVPLPPDLAPSLAVSCSDQMADAYRAVAPTLAECPGASVLRTPRHQHSGRLAAAARGHPDWRRWLLDLAGAGRARVRRSSRRSSSEALRARAEPEHLSASAAES